MTSVPQHARRMYQRIRTLSSCLALLGLPAAASAQTWDVQQLNPGPSQSHSIFNVSQARILGAWEWEIGLMTHYHDEPFVDDDGTGRITEFVGGQLTLNILGAVGIADRLEIGFDMPLVLDQQGDSFDEPATVPEASDAGVGPGDLRLVPRVLLLDTTSEDRAGVALSLAVNAWLPTGDSALYRSDGSYRLEPRIAFDVALPGELRFSANLGYMVRDELRIETIDIDDSITWGAGVDIPVNLARTLHVLGEFTGDIAVQTDEFEIEDMPSELNAGLRWHGRSGLLMQAGGGVGLNRRYGVPAWRAFFGLAFAATTDCDPDVDGLGCDGTVDLCPDDTEDIDGFENEDGCPDPDNDGDGILDPDDTCPDEAEDHDAFDNDDGCPDPDNDGDGILDPDDTCPDIAEDFDGFEDDDGCVEFDNERDGVLDSDDECPLEPEDFDGFEDEDGCPEEGEGAVRLTCEAIEIDEAVYFDSGAATIQERSHELLDQIAAVLRAASYVHLVRIEGHTDSQGAEELNMELSTARAEAVAIYLSQRGVDPARLTPVGRGEGFPVADNSTRSGRAANRRVEFHVVEQDSDCGEAEPAEATDSETGAAGEAADPGAGNGDSDAQGSDEGAE